MPDGRTLVSWGANEASDDRRSIESFGVSPVDGRIVVSAGWGERDVMMAEGIPGIGESLRKR